jgi:hypothetical protein
LNVSVGKWKFPCSQFCTAVSQIHSTPLIAPRNLDRKYKIILNFIDVKKHILLMHSTYSLPTPAINQYQREIHVWVLKSFKVLQQTFLFTLINRNFSWICIQIV